MKICGTDYPIVSQSTELQAFAKVPLTREEREKINVEERCKALGDDAAQKKRGSLTGGGGLF